MLHDFNLTYYSSIILGSFSILLFPKLCWHIGLTPNHGDSCYKYAICITSGNLKTTQTYNPLLCPLMAQWVTIVIMGFLFCHCHDICIYVRIIERTIVVSILGLELFSKNMCYRFYPTSLQK